MEITKKQIELQHLAWRAGFGPTLDNILKKGSTSRHQAVKNLLKDSADFTPLTTLDESQFADRKNLKGMLRNGALDKDSLKQQLQQSNKQIRDLNVAWLTQMASGKGVLREKMAFFWHGHFACRSRNPIATQRYVNTIRRHALGKFGDLLVAIAKEPSMLQFLNNQQNRKNAPNENFAREVMELFTLGRGHYTEHDIKDAARAFTGWGFNGEGSFIFRQNQHDDGPKTVFGQTGNFKGEDIIQFLLQQRQTARFITEKIYRFLVDDQYVIGDDASASKKHIDALADQFYERDYDIGALLKTIFTSDWFYDPHRIGTRIKSPVELLVGMQYTPGLHFEQKQLLVFLQRTLGQVLLYPPNVAGWPGGRSWIDSSSLLLRMKLPGILLHSDPMTIQSKGDGDVNTELLDRQGKGMPKVTVDWTSFAQVFEPIPDAQLPDILAGYLLQQPLGDNQRDVILQHLKPGSVRSEQIRRLTIALMSLPEYQLC